MILKKIFLLCKKRLIDLFIMDLNPHFSVKVGAYSLKRHKNTPSDDVSEGVFIKLIAT
jgi:hypothetical protein